MKILLASITGGETAVIAGAVAVFVGGLSTGVQYLLGRRADESARAVAKAATDSVIVNAQVAEATAHRAEEDARSNLYQEAAAQLGHEKAPVRLAGVYAMARLADDWPKQRQTCVDVLCAYLRMPWPANEGAVAEEHLVRVTVVDVIADRTNTDPQATPSWSDLIFDLRHAPLRDFALEGCTFGRIMDLRDAKFSGDCYIKDARFLKGATLQGCRITGTLMVENVTGISLNFIGTQVATDGELNLRPAAHVDQTLNPLMLGELKIEGLFQLMLQPALTAQPPIEVNPGTVFAGGILRVGAGLIGIEGLLRAPQPRCYPTLRISGWEVKTDGIIDIPQELIDDDIVIWATFPQLREPGAILTFVPKPQPHDKR